MSRIHCEMVITGVTPAEMENIRFAWTIMMVLLSLHTGVAEIVTRPTATEVVVGGSTFLNCSTNSQQEIHWFHTPFGSNQERNLVYGYDQFYLQYIGRFQMEKIEANGAYNLVIPVVKIEDAGVYECQDETGRGKKASAELIVLDANPVCEPQFNTHEIIGSNSCGIKPNQLIISCTVNYNGNEVPLLEWRRASDNISVREGVTNGTKDNNRMVYNLTINENSTAMDVDYYLCSTTRSTTSNGGCKSGKIEVKRTVAYYSASVPTEVCKPYIKPYSDAIICIIMIVLPVAIAGTVFVLWYLLAYRPKNKKQTDYSEQKRPLKSADCPTEESDLQLAETADNNQRLQSGDYNNDLKSNIKTSEKYVSKLQQRIQQLDQIIKDKVQQHDQIIKDKDQTISSLNEQDQSNIAKINSLQLANAEQLRANVKENDKLQAKINDLEQRLYPKGNIDYAEKPTLAHIIITDAGSQRREPINGMTILGRELFVSHENKSVIEVYDSETFQFGRTWAIEGMSHPMDIASCKISNCLYIIFREDSESESHVMKLDPMGQLIDKWPSGGESGRLSTYESNVIVCLSEKQLINEFNGDGNPIQTVRLSPAVGLNHPWHAIKVSNSHFVVCHGDVKDELHRVCIVDVQGSIVKELRGWKNEFIEGKFNVPVCLVEDSERSIMVADRDNKRIRLLNCFLKRQKDLIKKEGGLDGHPVRICLDERKGRLFVSENTLRSNKKEWKDGRILVFKIK